VTPATEAKKARESPMLVHSSPDQCQMATMYMGIEVSKVGYEEIQVYSWQIMAKAV
jgi:hypothetical protein